MKYAIFKGDVGLYSWLYIDNPKELKDYPYISEFDLPVLVNNAGGYHHFDEKYEKNFLEIRETPPTFEERYPKNSKEFFYGWIDPEGNTYNTGVEGHYSCSKYICDALGLNTYRPETELEKMGYVKITKAFGKTIVLSSDFTLTKKQADILFDLGLCELNDVKFLIEYNEKKW